VVYCYQIFCYIKGNIKIRNKRLLPTFDFHGVQYRNCLFMHDELCLCMTVLPDKLEDAHDSHDSNQSHHLPSLTDYLQQIKSLVLC
jgi:hypothetical protein